MVGPTAKNSTRSSTHYLSQSSLQLLKASVSTSTKQLYLRSYTLLHKFCAKQNVPFSLPFTEVLICNFIGDLFQQGYSPSTITSHVSAISYLHKLFILPDPTHSFIVRKTIKGTHNLAKSGDIRLPITKSILIKLLSALHHTVQEADTRVLLSTIFLLAFHAFMRLGELVARSSVYNTKVIQRQDLLFLDDNSVQLILRHSKNMKDGQPIVLTLAANYFNPQLCPVRALKTFTSLYQHKSGPLFTFKSGHPVSHSFVAAQLKHAIEFIGLDSSKYLGHSFRIGSLKQQKMGCLKM